MNSVLFSSRSDMWETPQEFFDKLNEEFHFDLDACAVPENAKCENYFTPEMDGLAQNWGGTEQFGAILRMGAALRNGFGKRLKRHSKVQPWSCWSMRGQIPDGSMTTFTAKQRYDLSKGDLNLEGAITMLRFRA